MAHTQVISTACHSEGLADILERVLDKGVVIAGDIQIRLLIASVDKAREMGMTWWWQSPEQLQPPQQPQPPHYVTAPQTAHSRPSVQMPSEDYDLLRQHAEQVEHIFRQQPRTSKG